MTPDRCKAVVTMGRRIARRARKLTARCYKGTIACPLSAREQLGHAETDGQQGAEFAAMGYCSQAAPLIRKARDAYAKAARSISQSKAVKTRRIVKL